MSGVPRAKRERRETADQGLFDGDGGVTRKVEERRVVREEDLECVNGRVGACRGCGQVARNTRLKTQQGRITTKGEECCRWEKTEKPEKRRLRCC